LSDQTLMLWIGSIALLLGTGMGVSSILQLLKAMAARNWEPVPGEVVETEIRVMSGGGQFTGAGSGRRGTYLPVITYRYTHAGQTYTRDQRRFGDFYGPERRARAIVHRYTPGQSVTVYVDPADPGRTVLERDLSWGLALLPLIALVFMGGGIAMIFLTN